MSERRVFTIDLDELNLTLEEQEIVMAKLKKSLKEKRLTAMDVKQVNVLMERDLHKHLESVAAIVSTFNVAENKSKVTVSDLIRKAVEEYFDYENVFIEKKLIPNSTTNPKEDGKSETVIRTKKTSKNSLAGHELFQKLMKEDW